MKLFLFTFLLFSSMFGQASRIKFGLNPGMIDQSAVLELESSSKGFLPPRMSTSERDSINSPAEGLCIFNTTTKQFEYNVGTPSSPLWEVSDGAPLSSSTKAGKIQLAGDLAGTADSPIINNDAVTSVKILDGTIKDADLENSYLKLSGGTVSGDFSSKSITDDGNSVVFNNKPTSNFSASINYQSVDYTVMQSDNGKILVFDSPSDITLTIPSGLALGFNCMVVQKNTGTINFSGSGSTLLIKGGYTKTGGQAAICAIVSIDTNSFIVGGDLQ